MKPPYEQTILLTGATDGIGKQTALRLAQLQYHLLVHGRNPGKLLQLISEIKEKTGNPHIEYYTADLSSLEEVRKLAIDVLNRHPQIEILINNAGVGFADPRYSKDGYELRFAVNYLAPFLLTRLLLPALKNAVSARIINVSSAGQLPLDFNNLMFEKNFDGVNAYRQSKLALIMFTIDLAEELKDEGITVNSLHPGTYLNTKMVRNAGIKPWGEVDSGADAEVFLATSPELEGVTGKYFDGKKQAEPLTQAYDKKVRNQLKDISYQLTGLV